jgi:hypothetical protein
LNEKLNQQKAKAWLQNIQFSRSQAKKTQVIFSSDIDTRNEEVFFKSFAVDADLQEASVVKSAQKTIRKKI